MVLTHKALDAIKKDKELRARLAIELDRTDFSVLRWVDENKDNNPLTTAGALKVIRRATKMKDNQILEETVKEQVIA